jgi:hypothetical protein
MSMLSNIQNPVPAAIEAEQGIIGTCLQSGGIPEDAAILEPDDFYRPAHALLWRRMREHGAEPIALADRLEQLGDLGQVGGRAYLATCIGYAGSIHFLADWVGIVKDRAGKRSLTDFAARMLSVVATEVSYADLVEQAERQLGRLDADPMDTLQPLHEFLGETFPEPDWLIDGLVCRDERLMITGSEGLGKTTLMRQLAYCCAAGMDPFNGRTTTPHRVLVLDFENPPHITHKRWWELHRAALSHQRPVDPGALWLDRLPQGVDLTKAADRRWIHHRVRHVQPDLLVVGPVYKMMMGATSEDKDEVIARTVQAFVDGLRAEFNLAVILEHHAGNAERNGVRELRPFGSSLWRRWVDFGYGIQEETDEKKHPNAEARRLVNVRAWKHPRDPRCWPQQLESRGDFMPWVEAVEQ